MTSGLMQSHPTPIRVLIVEDDEDIRETLFEGLSDHGFDIAAAANGEEALILLRSHLSDDDQLPEIILLDLMMPVMDGWKVLDVLKGDARFADIPVTIVSAARYQGTVQAARFIKKPLNIDLLIEAVRSFCPAA